ncbi:hypothetical protein [Geotalea toluenoxydans]|uniref:hypothetical protein n=1 Tax=Geotalea toluenoxydans TaxID=421624 RepID=UPI0006CFBC2D|nr:hypothetical protein [Geotalea toluenoxydans]
MKMNKMCTCLLLLLISCLCRPENSQALTLAKLILNVVDEKNQPVEGADIEICFVGGCTSDDVKNYKTDENGTCKVSGLSKDGQISAGITKKDYYSTLFHQDYYISKLGMWQPWNKEYTVVLRPKINPVPMYVREKWITIPVVGKEIGFDLVKFDWVIPYGQGVTSDFIFRVDRQYKDVDNFDAIMTLTFSNESDGIQLLKEDTGGDFNVGSRFRLPRNAPETGYVRKLAKRKTRGGGVFYDDAYEDSNYFFRVRSEKDEKGNLTRAMYGKIKGDIKIDPRSTETGDIHLFYYLNPDYTRNLEFDPDKNLFSPLPRSERLIGLP